MITDRFYHDGTILFEEGSPASEAFIIKSGAVEVSKLFDNKRVVLATIGAGQIVGELGVLRSHHERTAKAQAKGATEVLAIPQEYFDGMLEKLDAVGRQILLALATRVETTTRMKNFDRYENPLRSFYTLLETMSVGNDTGLDIATVYRTFRRVLGFQREELREVLARMERVKLIELHPSNRQPERVLITKQENVDKVIDDVTENLGADYFDFCLSSRDLVEFQAASEELGIGGDALWQAVVGGTIPRDAVYLGRMALEKLRPNTQPAAAEPAGEGDRDRDRDRDR